MATATEVAQPGTTALEVLVRDYLASCRARGLAPSTVNQAYGYSLNAVFLPWCASEGIETLAGVDQRVLDRFTSSLLERAGHRGRPLSRDTVHSYVRGVRQFLVWCQREGETVTGKPQLPRLTRRVLDVLSREEIERLEEAAPAERDKLIIRMLADTGVRVGELCGLRPADVVRSQDRRAFLKVVGKGSKERLVPLSPPLVRRLDRYLRSRPADALSDRLFLALRRGPHGEYAALTRSGVLQLMRGAAERAGLRKRVHPHLLRHSFATDALRKGMNPVQLAQVLGHSGLRMIEHVYSHLTATDAYDAVLKVLVAD